MNPNKPEGKNLDIEEQKPVNIRDSFDRMMGMRSEVASGSIQRTLDRHEVLLKQIIAALGDK